jgi:hypothetical protein
MFDRVTDFWDQSRGSRQTAAHAVAEGPVCQIVKTRTTRWTPR